LSHQDTNVIDLLIDMRRTTANRMGGSKQRPCWASILPRLARLQAAEQCCIRHAFPSTIQLDWTLVWGKALPISVLTPSTFDIPSTRHFREAAPN